MRYPKASTAAVLALFVAAASPVLARSGPDPSRVPACSSAGNNDACRLPLRDGDFSAGSLMSWKREGLPSVGDGGGGSTYAALPVGSAISQAIGIPTGNLPQHVAYVVRFRVLGESADGSVDVRLALSDDNGNQRVDLGGTAVHVVHGGWTAGELYVTGKPYGGAPHVHLTLANDSRSGTQVQIDDVYVVESVDAAAR
jgi:hypothetical protein